MKIWRIFFGFCLLGSMIFIFCNSQADAAASSKTSQAVTEHVASAVVPDYSKLPPAEQKKSVEKLEGVVRELAHGLEFVPLGFFLLLFLGTFQTLGARRAAWWLLLLCTTAGALLYGIIDEIHQLFVPGRSFEVKDFMIDTAGAVLGALAALLLRALLQWLRGRVRKRYAAEA